MIVSISSRLLIVAAAALTFCASAPLSVTATPLFEATAGTDSRSGTTPVLAADSATFVSGALTRSYSAAARSDQGSVGATADSNVSIFGAQSCSGCSIGTTAFARARFDDLMFSGPADDVTTSLNLLIAGSLTTGGMLGAAFESFDSTASASFFASVAEPRFFGPLILGDSASGLSARHTESNDPAFLFMQTSRSGDLGSATFNADSIAVNEIVTSRMFSVPVDELLILTLEMRVSTSARVDARLGGGHAVSSSANGDFFDSFSLPASGPVFNLPEGFTVNSVSGLIVDNRWVGGSTAPVPEPASLALLGAGIVGIVGAGWRRGRRNV